MIKNDKMIKQITLVCTIAVVFCAVIMFATMYMPYIEATESRQAFLDKTPDAMLHPESKLTYKELDMLSVKNVADILDISEICEMKFGSAGIVARYGSYMVFLGLFSALAAFFAILKKPVATLTFVVWTFIVFIVQSHDYFKYDFIDDKLYRCGIAHPIFYLAFTVALAAAITLMVFKFKAKKD